MSSLLIRISVILLSLSTFADAASVDFEKEVAPILKSHCLRCHLPGEENGDVSLATIQDLRSNDYIIPGDADNSYLLDLISPSGVKPAEMPKDGEPLTPEQIALVRRWVNEGANWPDKFVLEAESHIDANWWSLLPPQAVSIPINEDAPENWQNNPINAFIFRKLQQQGLSPSPPAERQTLIRRLALDMTGLPPSWSEVTEFVNDPDDIDTAFKKVVDRLLQSPRYGERWAQHWLDVIRWAETVGFETNKSRPNAWPYRDWVIDSLNEDKPYDRFIFEQVAGDTVGEDAALGFLVAGPANLPGQIGRDESAMRQARQDELDEVIKTVSQSLLGLTVGCARCHNHKFDPILQKDYYSMQAIFAGLSYGDRRWRGDQNDQWTAQVPQVQDELAKLRAKRETLRQKYGLRPEVATVQTETFDARLAKSIRMRIEATGNRGAASLYEFEVFEADNPNRNVALASAGAIASASGFALANQTRHFDNLIDGSIDKRQAFPWVNDKGGPAWIQVDFKEPTVINKVVWHNGSSTPADYVIEVQAPDSDEWNEVAHTRDRIPRINDTRPVEQIQLDGLESKAVSEIVSNQDQLRATQNKLNRLTAGPQVYGANFTDQPEPTWVLRRGDAMQRSEIVEPSVPVVLLNNVESTSTQTLQAERDRRLALAKHLTQPDHPLTARVIVNRIWQHHFGTGLVSTPSDFGKMGAKPSHPELLDWLAVEFVDNGWSLKWLHRLIVTSQTYRQSSRPNPEALKIDADARLLWRFPPRRLEAEAIRDSILAVSGKLNLQTGGPGFDFFQQRGGLSDYTAHQTFDESGWRRMIYAHKIRMQAIDIFGAFDCPDGGQMKPKRTRSITPLQSLSLLNSPFVNRQVDFFAERVRSEVGSSVEDQINRIFESAYSRQPKPKERERLITLANTHGLEQVCRVIFNTSEFVFLK